MGFVLMFDLTSEPTFVNIRGWLTTLRTHAYCERPDVVLIGNKLDLADGARGLRAVPTERAAQLARQYEYVPLLHSAPIHSTRTLFETCTHSAHVSSQRPPRPPQLLALLAPLAPLSSTGILLHKRQCLYCSPQALSTHSFISYLLVCYQSIRV